MHGNGIAERINFMRFNMNFVNIGKIFFFKCFPIKNINIVLNYFKKN